MSKQNYKSLLCLFSALLWNPAVTAGSVEGHRIIWINLAADPAPIDQRVRNFLEAGNDICGEQDSYLVFMRKTPPGFTKALVRRALVDQDKDAIKEVQRLLATAWGTADEYADAFDGIMAYSDWPAPKMYSMTAGRSRVDSIGFAIVERKGNVERVWCTLKPPIARAP